ncbi:NrtR DNA-binding winged helix domain-containing protein [Nibricoccus sp. IMCC34717]|uniref:NUDIX hydrolase n=1 Tax=Nibricoccus sp. IMCC34717 TaxID=3034021 RepID=UPI00384AD4D8
MFQYKYPRPAVAVDLVLFGIIDQKLVALLGERSAPPYKGRLCLPGTYVRENESAADACDRKIKAIGLEHSYLEQLATFSEPNRDPRERVVTIAHYGLIAVPQHVPQGDEKIKNLEWIEPGAAAKRNWGFDHGAIFEAAVQRLRAKIQYAPVSPHFLKHDFTLTELSQVYGAILGRKLDLSNFRRDLLKQDLVIATGKKQVRGPVATTYRWNWERKGGFFLSLG